MKKKLTSYLAGLLIYSLIIGLIFITLDKKKQSQTLAKQTFKTQLIYKQTNTNKTKENEKKSYKKKSTPIKKKSTSSLKKTNKKKHTKQKKTIKTTNSTTSLKQTQRSKIYTILDLDNQPEIMISTEPKYPEFAKQEGIEGLVILKLIIDTDGSVIKVTVIKSLKEYGFDEEAIKAVKKWKFSKCSVKGTPVKYTIFQPIAFKLI